jgi:hypothetical protein
MYCRYLFSCLVTAFCLIVFAADGAAQEKTGVKEGFILEPGSARIVLMRPTVRVGSQSTAGMFEPNADWTAQARENIERELSAVQRSLGNEVIRLEDGPAGTDPLIAQYSSLFGAVAHSVMEYQFFRGNRLPTKKRDKKALNWGVGPGLASLQSLRGADYALFIWTHDAYGSTGRKLLQAAVFLAAFLPVGSGEHQGYAGLIDLRTGELVWLNADMSMGGDVRTPEGTQKRVAQLLEGFPGRPPTQPQAEAR